MSWRKNLIILISIILFIWLYNYWQISQFNIKNIKLSSNKIKQPLKIVQITDFHSNELINLDKMFNKISQFNPDIIVLTGDIIDYKTVDLTLVLNMLDRVKSITSKVYFVSGNHETNHNLEKELHNAFVEKGIKVLDNNTVLIENNGDRINLFGASFFAEQSDFENIFENIKEENYNILLSHSPNRPIRYLNENTDLILSGHTHGGQVRIPIIGAIIAPGQGLFPKYDKGIKKLGNTTLYIDSGLGNSVAPIRMFNRVQYTNIEIEPEN